MIPLPLPDPETAVSPGVILNLVGHLLLAGYGLMEALKHFCLL